MGESAAELPYKRAVGGLSLMWRAHGGLCIGGERRSFTRNRVLRANQMFTSSPQILLQRSQQVVDRFPVGVLERFGTVDDAGEDVHRFFGQVVRILAVLGEAHDVAKEDRFER